MTSSKSSQYSTESTTTEVCEIPQFARRTLSISIVTETLSAAILIFICVYQITICSRIKFVGLTPLFGLLLFVISLATGYTTYSQHRKCSLVIAIVALVITIVLLIHEITCWLCIEEEISSRLCSNFNETFNTCKWMGPAKLKTTTKIPKHSKVPSSSVKPKDESFTEERIVLMSLSTICFICCFISVVLIFIIVKMGKPVYLNKKRHKGSIVVGDKVNVGLSNKNRLRNIGTTRATGEELKQYDLTRIKAFTEQKSEVFTSAAVAQSRTKTESSKVSNADQRHRSKSKVASTSNSRSPSPGESSADTKVETKSRSK